MDQIVVTRHSALIEFLRERGLVGDDVRVIAQASPEDVRGKHVIGVLPLHLAALADRVTVVDIATPPELRGVELSLQQLREYARGVTTYRVQVMCT